MPDRWWISVCPECNGRVEGNITTHNETCPNRYRLFVPRSVEVVPADDRPHTLRATGLETIPS